MSKPFKKIVVTGGAGFIGHNLLRHLAQTFGCQLISIDNLSTGYARNYDQPELTANFDTIEADVNDGQAVASALAGADAVIHLAALGSVPRSFADPAATHHANATGFLTVLKTAIDFGIPRFIYASSSSVYGDSPTLPKCEEHKGNLLSPYAVTKALNEDYGRLLTKGTSTSAIGLRFFNVFGPGQSPEGAYAAVIPRFIEATSEGKPLFIYGDGLQTRDFTYVQNVVEAIAQCLVATLEPGSHHVLNIGCGEQIDLLTVAKTIAGHTRTGSQIQHGPPRPGDIRDSLADISAARRLIGYDPQIDVKTGLRLTLERSLSKG